MNIMQILVMGGALFLAGVGCSKENGSAGGNSGSLDTVAWEKNVTGDKEKMAALMLQSHAKGTFDDALQLLLADSTIAMQIISTLKEDPRLAGMFASATVATPSTGGSSRTAAAASRSRSTTRSTATATPKKDPLDKAEDGVRKANEKLDQAARIRQAAEEARRKAEKVLRP